MSLPVFFTDGLPNGDTVSRISSSRKRTAFIITGKNRREHDKQPYVVRSEAKDVNSNVLSLFHPIIRQWFSEQVGTPTDVQEKVWPQIARNRHVLVTAPTGCGKTLAAFLWGINQLITGA